MTSTIVLTWREAIQAAAVGVRRVIEARKGGWRDTYGSENREPWGNNIEGAAGEMVVAKYFDRYWSGVSRPKVPDVGDLEVRTAFPGRRLIVHPGDADDAPFVFVIGRIPKFTIRGWIVGRDAKDPAYWEDPTGLGCPAFFVPDDRLNPIDTLTARYERTATHDDDRRPAIPSGGR